MASMAQIPWGRNHLPHLEALYLNLFDSDEAAKIMNVHPKTLQKLARKGIVHGVYVGKLWRFRASTIEGWIQRQLAS